MKTNQVMIRPMGDFSVEQRTKDSYFNATALLKQWNATHNTDKAIAEYTRNKATSEFVETIAKRENLKGEKSPLLVTRGKSGGTWMHPLLFIDFAMWINPEFKYDVLKFVQDEMIHFRLLAGDAYPRMCKAVGVLIPKEQYKAAFSKLGRSLNMIVYGRHEAEIRNKIGNEAKIREMYELEAQIATWIELGLVTTKEQLSKALNKLYIQKHSPVISL